jgi:hypothetical protein
MASHIRMKISYTNMPTPGVMKAHMIPTIQEVEAGGSLVVGQPK